MMASITGNVFGFKALPRCGSRTCASRSRTSRRSRARRTGSRSSATSLNKYGRPLLGATLKPKLGLSAKNYGRACFELLVGGLDFTKDDENITSQPFMRWRDRYTFVMEAVRKAEEQTGERKGHYLNVTAPDVEQMIERAEYAKELGSPIIMHDYLVGGLRRAPDAVELVPPQRDAPARAPRAARGDRPAAQPRHQLPRAGQVAAPRRRRPSALRAPSSASSRATGRRRSGILDLLREDYIPADRSRGIYFDQDWASLPGRHAGRLGRHPRLAHARPRRRSSATTRSSSSAAGPLGTRGSRAGATANRVALEACVKARNEGRELRSRASRSCARGRAPPGAGRGARDLAEITFEFDTVDTLDPAARMTTPRLRRSATCRS